MGQARDEVGNLWETDEQGNAIRLIQPASAPASPGIVPPNPARFAEKQREAARQDASDARAERQDKREQARFEREDMVAKAPGDITKTGDEYLATLPMALAAQVKALSEGRRAFPTGAALRSPQTQELIAAASQYDPSLDATSAATRVATRKDFTSGKAAQNITSINTALGHLGTLWKASNELGNRRIPAWNWLANTAESAAGDPSQKRFSIARDAVANELMRVFRGTGGSLTEIEEWKRTIGSSDSPQQLRAEIGQAVELLSSRLDAMSQQYSQGMGRSSDAFTLLKPHSQAVFNALAPGGNGVIDETVDKTSAIDSPNALPSDQQSVATGDTKTEQVRGPVEKKLSAMLKSGASSANIRAFAKQNAFPAGKVERVLAWRAMNPQYKGAYDVSTEVIKPTTPFNRFEASPIATIATQAANATSAGLLDEIGGATNALVTGAPLDEAIAAADMNKQAQAALNPKSTLAGNVIGGTAAMIGGGGLLQAGLRAGARGGIGRNALAWAARNPIKAAAVGDAGYGAAYGAGEMNDNRLGGAAVGAPSALVGSFLGSGATRAIGAGVRGVVDPAIDRLREAGIPLTAGEVLGGGWKRAQDAMTTVFGPGDMVARRYGEGRRALNEAAFNAAGDTVGQPINAVGQEGIDLLNQAKNTAYTDALNPVRINLNEPRFVGDIRRLGNQIANIPNDDGVREAATNAIQYRIGNSVDDVGGMTGRNFQEAYRGLARAPRERGPQRPYAHEFGQAMRSAQDALVGVLERQEPGAYQGFLNANSANRHLNILADAVNAAKNQIDDGGEPLFTPAQLNTAATANTKNYGGKLAAAMGNKPFNQLINDSQRVMSSKLPTSGTGERLLMTGLLTGGTGALGGGAGYAMGDGEGATAGATAPAAVLTLLGTRRGQQALTAALLRRAAPFRRAGTALTNNANVGGDVLTSAGIPLLYPPTP